MNSYHRHLLPVGEAEVPIHCCQLHDPLQQLRLPPRQSSTPPLFVHVHARLWIGGNVNVKVRLVVYHAVVLDGLGSTMMLMLGMWDWDVEKRGRGSSF